MSMIKRGITKSKVTFSSLVYMCKCGYTEMGKRKGKQKKCPKCGEIMDVITSQDEVSEDKE